MAPFQTKMSAFEEFMDSGRDSNIMLYAMSYLFPAISAFATCVGVVNLLGHNAVSYVTGVGIFVVAFLLSGLFYRKALVAYPELSPERRKALRKHIIGFVVAMLCLTTFFSVIAFGGSVALRKSMQSTEQEAELMVRENLKPLRAEQALALSLDSYATDFKNLAGEEEKGAFTGVTGRGSAAVTFATVGQSLEIMRDQVLANKPVVDRLKARADALLLDMRKVPYRNLSQEDKQTQFEQDVNNLHDLIDQMKASAVAPSIQQSARSLDSIAQLQVSDAKTAVGAKQTAAIAKASGLVSHVRADIDSAAQAARSTGDKEMAPLTFMEQSEAVFHYWYAIVYAYAAALAIDFSPLFFLFINAVYRDAERGRRRPKSGATVEDLAAHRRS